MSRPIEKPADPTTRLGTIRLKKVGGSLTVTVPSSARKLLQLKEGQEMLVSIEGEKVVMEPVTQAAPLRARAPRYTLDALLAGLDPDVPLSEDERAWQEAPARGREAW